MRAPSKKSKTNMAYYQLAMPTPIDVGIRMKVAQSQPSGVLFMDDKDDDEHEQLIVVHQNRFRGLWYYLPRVTLVVLLLATTLTVLSLIMKEYYLLSDQRSFNLQFYTAPDVPTLSPPFSLSRQCDMQTERKFDCHPEPDATEHSCAERKCCWTPQDPASGIPSCFYSKNQYFYKWSDPNVTDFGLETTGIIILRSPFQDNIKLLTMRVYFETEDTVRVKIFDAHKARFEVPLSYNASTKKAPSQNYEVQISLYGFKIFRKGMTFPLFDSTVAPIAFANELLEISTSLPSEFVYGIGEQQDSLARNMNWTRSVLWAHDKIPGDKNLYGSHPFYLCMETDGSSHGVFLANSNAMEVILQPNPTPAVTFRTIGGILDLRIFVGPKPSNVISQYTSVIGRPMLPPYWSLGFHLCRFNYPTLAHTKEILTNNVNAGIPIDVQWNDLDYMDDRKDFTYDSHKFGDLHTFVEQLHADGRHYIPLVDPGISGGEAPGTYAPYDDGITADVFIKDHKGDIFVGKVWNPESTVWPDFTHPNITHYWMTQLDRFHSNVSFDGIWLDMNEISNFWDGAKDGCPLNSTLDHPHYVPRVDGGKLYYKTICPSAKQYKGSHYDLHNLYGTYETIVTYNAIGDIRSERPFIISRSTFPGQGHYGGHWTGDVMSSWDHMRASIPQILSFGLFGIPMTGADICGFNGNTSVKLCKRWMQLGAFYPFSRNHNTDDAIAQDPWSLGEEVVEASKAALNIRYSLLPYLYSVFFHAYLTGEPVARAMFYEFPNDVMTYKIETQFMLGASVLVVPVLEEHQKSTVDVYLPTGWWYQHYDNAIIDSLGEVKSLTIPERNHSIPVLYRSGSIVVRQIPGLTTTESRKNKFSIHIYLDKKGEACGELFWDDGVTNLENIVGTYNKFVMTVKNSFFMMDVDRYGYDAANMTLGYIEVRGILTGVGSVLLNNIPWNYTMMEESRTLELVDLNLAMKDGLQLKWSA